MPELLGTPSQISCWGFTCTTMGDLSPRRPNLLYHFQKRSAAPSTRQRDDAVHTENDRHYNGVCGKKQKEEYYEESNESTAIGGGSRRDPQLPLYCRGLAETPNSPSIAAHLLRYTVFTA